MQQTCTPEQFLHVLKTAPETKRYVLSNRRKQIQRYIDDIDITLSPHELLRVATVIEYIDLHLPFDAVRQFVSICPTIASEVRYSGTDTETVDHILNLLSIFLLGTPFKDCAELKGQIRQQALLIWPDGRVLCV